MKFSIYRFNPEHDAKPFMQDFDQPIGANDHMLLECILCGCCTSQCPSSWWNPEKFFGPAGSLQADRYIADSRDRATRERLDDLNDVYRLFRCRSIMNRTEVCPKGLAPSRAIESIRLTLLKEAL